MEILYALGYTMLFLYALGFVLGLLILVWLVIRE